MIAAAAIATWVLGSSRAWLGLRRALDRPGPAQERVLRRIVAAGESSAFGRAHDLRGARSPSAFASRVPLARWDDLAPWIERAASGEPDVLTTSPVTRFEPTSGSTRARKLVPSTPASRAELRRAVGAWVADTYGRDPALARGPAYWSISPTVPAERTAGGIPVGFDDDASILGGWVEAVVRRGLVGPPRGLDGEAFWGATADALIAARDLTLISVWSPSFGSLLLDAVERRGGAAWPRLRLLSAWADASAAPEVERLRARLPGVAFQAKGLLATEGIVSVPFGGAHPLALTSHYLELERDDGEVIPLWTARPGDEGCVVLTTGAGLWRYQLRDRIAVTARLRATPTIRFLGRQDRVSDLRGEKLAEPFVAAVLADLPGFALLAPEGDRYVLYAEHAVDPGAIDARLCENPHYRWCRSVGQLGPLGWVRVGPDAGARYVAHKAASGQRWGDVKLPRLETVGGWATLGQPTRDTG